MTESQPKAIFQNFEIISPGEKGGERLKSLRQLMKEKGLDVWLVPYADEYQNEYLPAYAERLAWLTGFTGSAGFCIVTHSEAILLVDGRYALQAPGQVDSDHFTVGNLLEEPPCTWLARWVKENWQNRIIQIGFDPWLITISDKKRFEEELDSEKAILVTEKNLIDKIWTDQPPPPLEPVSIQPEKFSGKPASEKIRELKKKLADDNGNLCLITDPASIAWLFNIRGGDTPHTPLPLGYAIIRAHGQPLLFMDERKIPQETKARLTQLASLYPPKQLEQELKSLAHKTGVCTDPAKASVAIADIVKSNGGHIIQKTDPVTLPRAIKNRHEIEGSRNAHLRDGVAFTRFLYWLETQEPGTINEIGAVEKLETLRRNVAKKFDSQLMDISFDSISGAGANGAIQHYRVTRESAATLGKNSLYLIDSGAQYQDGTTDITRTIAIGSPPPEAALNFTLVLKGHIAIAMARFPKKTKGMAIDCLARSALWRHGRDYTHGTGHGVGSYLSVHEGPQSISCRGTAELKPGMILSNEPGFYCEGKYGIRIENLVLVKEPQEFEGGDTPVMSFETLSMAPIDLRLVRVELMNTDELHWLNAYHGWTRRQLSPFLNEHEKSWLEKSTMPVSRELPAASA